MLYSMQMKLCRYDKLVHNFKCVYNYAENLVKKLGNLWKILGNNRIMYGNLWGLKGYTKELHFIIHTTDQFASE